ncbi:hypothetical protein PENSPDRAFT_759492 [Peniophora sp. CONT]|nr:hypothetical protein PENSPDRAFT_759492 [Peniophora sp. CONT]
MSFEPTYPPMLADYEFDASPSPYPYDDDSPYPYDDDSPYAYAYDSPYPYDDDDSPYPYDDDFNFNAYPQMAFPSSPVYSEPVAFWRSLDFPAEIIYMIIEAADDDPDLPTYDSELDLHRFLFVNRKWRAQAERYIYMYVHVTEGLILLFWRTIFDRPDLATYVKELHFGGGIAEDVGECHLDMIVNGLMMLEHLKDLSLWTGKGGSELNHILSSTSTFILRNPFPFKLFRFCTDFEWSEDLRDFLIKQSDIRILYLSVTQDFTASYELPAGSLPQLRCIQASPGILKDFVSVPPITHAYMAFYNHDALEEAFGAKEVGRLGGSLKVLGFARNNWMDDLAYLSPGALLRAVAASCTNLVILSTYDLWHDWSPRDHSAVLRVVTENFPQLRLFIWGSRHEPTGSIGTWEAEEGDGFNTEADDDDEALEKIQLFAWEFFTRHCTGTLEFVVNAGFNRTPPATIFVKDPAGGLPYMEGSLRPARSNKFAFEFHDPEAPMDYICGEYPNPDRFDRSVGWRPEYSHFLRHTILFPGSSPADYIDRSFITCPPVPRTWGKVGTADYDDDSDELFEY